MNCINAIYREGCIWCTLYYGACKDVQHCQIRKENEANEVLEEES